MQSAAYSAQPTSSSSSFQADPKYLGQLMMNDPAKYLGGLADNNGSAANMHDTKFHLQAEAESKYSHAAANAAESKYQGWKIIS